MEKQINSPRHIQGRVQECIEELGFKSRTIECSPSGDVAMSALYNSAGFEMAAGPGNGSCAIFKSQAESVEHFCFFNDCPPWTTESVESVFMQPAFLRAKNLKSIISESQVDVTNFTSLSNPNRTIRVPTNLIACGSKDRSNHMFQSMLSTSGCAFHSSRELALVHGCLEIFERHEFSNFLLQPETGFLVTKESLSDRTQSFIKAMEQNYKGRIEVVHLQRDECPLHTIVTILFPESDRFPIPQTAQKSNRSAQAALEGALSELNQVLFLYSEDEKTEDVNALANFKARPDLLRIVELQFAWDKLPRENLVSEIEPSSSLQELVGDIEKLGFEPVFRVLKKFKNGSVVIQVFVPGMDKWNLIRLGVQLEPYV